MAAAVASSHRHDSSATSGGGLSDFAASDALIAMESQLRTRSHEVVSLREEVNLLKKQQLAEADAKKDGAQNAGASGQQQNPNTNAMAATLMAQIQFLHGEVERQDKELKAVRQKSAESNRAIHAEQMRVITEKVQEVDELSAANAKLKSLIAPLQRKVGRVDNGEDLFTRCKMLETQLAHALAERSTAMTEKHNANTKMRKMESALKGSRQSVSAVENAAEEEAHAADDEAHGLRNVIQALGVQKAQLSEEVAAYRARDQSRRNQLTVEVQCDAPSPTMVTSVQTDVQTPKTFEVAACQVDSLRHRGDTYSGESAVVVAHQYEVKCAEYDATRADLDRLSSTHAETLSYLELTKKRLGDELQQRAVLEEDNEKLLVQVRALQQQNSQLNATIREQYNVVRVAEEKAQHAINGSMRLEEDRRQWEVDQQAQQYDMQQLVAQQNFTTQQMATLSEENDKLREDVQQLLRREAQCGYSLKAKDQELQEVVACYQGAVRDGEKHSHAVQTLQREGDNLRAAVAQRQERIIALEDQVGQLHAREQQLAVDLQNCDYEGGVMHKKLVQQESGSSALKHELHDMQNQLAARERVTFEFERSNAELNKQLVVKENELMLCRSRGDELEHQMTILQTTHNVEHQRLHELEENNAKLVVNKILTEQRSGSGHSGSTHHTSSSAHSGSGSRHSSHSPHQQQPSSISPDAPRASTPPHFPHAQ